MQSENSLFNIHTCTKSRVLMCESIESYVFISCYKN